MLRPFELLFLPPFHEGPDPQRRQREQRQQTRNGKGCGSVILVIQLLYSQRHGIRLARDVTRNHRDRSELSHGPGVAENDSVDQAPLH